MTSLPACRICLRSDVSLNFLSREGSLAVKEIFWIDIEQETEFKLCESCNDELLNFYKFYLKVKENQIIFKERQATKISDIPSENEDFPPDLDPQSDFEEDVKAPSQKYSSKKTHKCKICHRAYSTANYLAKHIEKHFDPVQKKKFEKPTYQLVCDICGQKRPDRAKMRSHIETVHLKLKDATCHICGAYFHRTHIQAHIKKMHRDNKKREKCDECGKFFLDLKQHKARNHNEQASVFCEICKKPFKNRMLLSSHRFKRHPPEGKYDCHECKKKFTNPVGLKEHKAAHHAGVYLYNCEFCDYRGSYKKNLFDHWKRNHREYYDHRRQLFLARHDTEIAPNIDDF
ncbi:zinc finger protein 675-like [Culicoides brevitarsis]|uniref:zinc finger protein 675-like n=1 Tax=Culicoides brevitarsis TaxID=469753 RepID=UPI00307BB094